MTTTLPVRARLARVLEPAAGKEHRLSHAVDVGVIALIVLNVVTVIASTVPDVDARFGGYFRVAEIVFLAAYSAEYLLRLWIAPDVTHDSHALRSRLRWMRSPLAIIDLAAILPFYAFLAFPDAEALRLSRVFITIRLLKLGRYSSSMQTFGNVLRSKARDLALVGVVLLVLLVFTSSAMYVVENAAGSEGFGSIPQTMWWAIVTLTTVGYGDVYPQTVLGKSLGALIAIIGIGLFALPAGLLATGFTEEVERKRKASTVPDGAARGGPAACPHCGRDVNDPPRPRGDEAA